MTLRSMATYRYTTENDYHVKKLTMFWVGDGIMLTKHQFNARITKVAKEKRHISLHYKLDLRMSLRPSSSNVLTVATDGEKTRCGIFQEN